MTANSNAKLKLLYIMRMLEEETDSEHGLTMQQIITRLEEEGISAERKGIYRDIGLLKDFGLKIETYQRNPVEYALSQRDFSLPQLMLLVDSVESCKSLTKRQADMLEGNIKSLASTSQQELLDRRINVVDRVKSKNDSVFGEIDTIHEAMRTRRKVSFRYMHYDVHGRRRAQDGGKTRLVTPLDISYDDGFYYLGAWSDADGDFREYRIDRMSNLTVSDEKATSNEQTRQRSQKDDDYQAFGHFRNQSKKIIATLSVRGDKVEIIMDRFGERAQIWADGENAKATVKIYESVQFYGWVAGLDGLVTIDGPQDLVGRYRDYLRKLLGE